MRFRVQRGKVDWYVVSEHGASVYRTPLKSDAGDVAVAMERLTRGSLPMTYNKDDPDVDVSRWMSPRGLVHMRRLRNFVGTKDEKVLPEDYVRTLCGRDYDITLAPPGEPVTCGICLQSMGTRAHLLQ